MSETSAEPGAGALQQALHRRDRNLEHLSGFGRRQGKHLAQDERGTLTWRKHLETGDKSQTDPLPSLRHFRRIPTVIDHEVVGRGLQPQMSSGAG